MWILAFAAAALIWFPISQSIFLILWIIGRFLAQSAEALVIYEKTFAAATIIETASFAVFCAAFFLLKSSFDAELLLIIYSFYQLLKGIWYTAYFKRFLSVSNLKWQPDYFRNALPFFLLSLLGFLASKVDVYLIALMKDRIATANYQIINSLLVFIMSLSAFVYAPFTKNIYRNSEAVINKTRNTLQLSGLLIVPLSLFATSIILKNYLQLSFSIWFYVIAFAYVFPAFVYGIDVVNLFRLKKEKTVVVYLFIGAFSNTAFSAGLIYFGFGIPGALAGSAISQLIVLTLFKLHREK
ncbi:MAG: hypothetical protein EOO48_04215 [Flavobacterium sp.]|nr:MAG: hypothetical protein EOO48_04215 [Flavobacterium sp.]